jgi:hypothetical protein
MLNTDVINTSLKGKRSAQLKKRYCPARWVYSKAFIKERGADVFREICPSPIL